MRKAIHTLFMLLTLCFAAHASFDSLKNELKRYTQQQNIDSMLKKTIQLGTGYLEAGNNDSSLAYYKKSITLAEALQDTQRLINLNLRVGVLYFYSSQEYDALEHYNQSLSLAVAVNDSSSVANLYNNIGLIYQHQGDAEHAIQFFKRSLRLKKELNLSSLGDAYWNIAMIYDQDDIDNQDSTIYYIRGAEKAYNSVSDPYSKASYYLCRGYRLSLLGRYDSSITAYKYSILLYDSLDNKDYLPEIYNDLAKAYLAIDRLDSARHYAKIGYDLSLKVGYTEYVMHCASTLDEVYKRMGNWQQAYTYFEVYVAMNDSIHNAKNEKALSRQQAKFEYEKQKALDEQKFNSQLLLERREKEKQQAITISIAIGLIVAIVLLFIIFDRLKTTKKQNMVIEEQKNKVEEAHDQIRESINYAKRIQSAILPSPLLVKKHLPDSFILYQPKDVVAGDFYWLEQVGNTTLFAAADCTGHGVPGAMVSVVCHNAMNRAVREYKLVDPGKILDKTREIVMEELSKSEESVKDGMDIALCVLEGNVLRFAGAFNPVWIARGEEIIEIKGDKQPIGKAERSSPFTTHELALESGDTIYVFSDGFSDQFGGDKDKKYGSRRLRQTLIELQPKNMTAQKEALLKAFNDWKTDQPQLDDVCVIGVKV